jgi:hypothetical protein
MPVGDSCWKDWGIRLRMRMMRQRTPEVTLPIRQIYDEVGTDEPFENVTSYGFWNSCRRHIDAWNTLFKQGIEVDFEVNAEGKVNEVTFMLNESWQSLLEGR